MAGLSGQHGRQIYAGFITGCQAKKACTCCVAEGAPSVLQVGLILFADRIYKAHTAEKNLTFNVCLGCSECIRSSSAA
jgi:hypothetical protein